MSGRILTQEELCAPATHLAPALVGKLLCRTLADGGVLRLRITETECYFGEEDSACHAHRGKTPRNAVMYGAGGYAYVYLCYGMHHMLNVVTGEEGHPEAVLLRGVEGATGPGKLTKHMQIDRAQNGILLCPASGLWLEDDGMTPSCLALPRVGIGYATPEDVARPWRYLAQSK